MAAPAIGRRKWAPRASAQIDWSHPLAAGLVTYLLPMEGTRTWFDFVARVVRVQTPLFRAPATQGSPYGPAVRSDQDHTDSLSFTPTQAIGSGFTTLVGYRYLTPNLSNAFTAPLIKIGAVNAANQVHYFYPTSTANRIDVSNFGNDLAGTSVLDNTDQLLSSTYGAALNAMWANGRRVATGTAAAYTGTSAVQFGTCYGFYTLGAAWNRQLNDAQVADLHADPFCILRF